MIRCPSPWALPPSPDDGGTSMDYIGGAGGEGNDSDGNDDEGNDNDVPPPLPPHTRTHTDTEL